MNAIKRSYLIYQAGLIKVLSNSAAGNKNIMLTALIYLYLVNYYGCHI